MGDVSRSDSDVRNGDAKSGGYTSPSRNDSGSQSHSKVYNEAELVDRVIGPRYGLFSAGSAKAMKTYLKMFMPPFVMIWILILGIMSIYWGVYYQQQIYYHKYAVYLVDFDGQSVGPPIIQALLEIQSQAPATTLGYQSIDRSVYGNPENVANGIVDEDAWFAVVIQPNATSGLQQALASGDASYNGRYAVTLYYASGRLEAAVTGTILPLVQSQLTTILPSLNANLTSTFLRANIANAQALTTALSASSALANPIGYNPIDLRPSNLIPQATPAVQVGLIYLLIFAFTTVAVGAGARAMSGLEGHLRLPSLIIFRLGLPFTAYTILSLLYSLVSLAFQIPFQDGPYGRGTFPMYWLLNYCTMLSLGLTMEFFETIFGPKASFVLVPLIILNVSPTFKSLVGSPDIYRYGYAMQFYNAAQGSRTLIFNTKNRLGVNFGVLIAWIAVNVCTITLAVVWTRRRADRQKMRAATAKLESEKQGQMEE